MKLVISWYLLRNTQGRREILCASLFFFLLNPSLCFFNSSFFIACWINNKIKYFDPLLLFFFSFISTKLKKRVEGRKFFFFLLASKHAKTESFGDCMPSMSRIIVSQDDLEYRISNIWIWICHRNNRLTSNNSSKMKRI